MTKERNKLLNNAKINAMNMEHIKQTDPRR